MTLNATTAADQSHNSQNGGSLFPENIDGLGPTWQSDIAESIKASLTASRVDLRDINNIVTEQRFTRVVGSVINQFLQSIIKDTSKRNDFIREVLSGTIDAIKSLKRLNFNSTEDEVERLLDGFFATLRSGLQDSTVRSVVMSEQQTRLVQAISLSVPGDKKSIARMASEVRRNETDIVAGITATFLKLGLGSLATAPAVGTIVNTVDPNAAVGIGTKLLGGLLPASIQAHLISKLSKTSLGLKLADAKAKKDPATGKYPKPSTFGDAMSKAKWPILLALAIGGAGEFPGSASVSADRSHMNTLGVKRISKANDSYIDTLQLLASGQQSAARILAGTSRDLLATEAGRGNKIGPMYKYESAILNGGTFGASDEGALRGLNDELVRYKSSLKGLSVPKLLQKKGENFSVFIANGGSISLADKINTIFAKATSALKDVQSDVQLGGVMNKEVEKTKVPITFSPAEVLTGVDMHPLSDREEVAAAMQEILKAAQKSKNDIDEVNAYVRAIMKLTDDALKAGERKAIASGQTVYTSNPLTIPTPQIDDLDTSGVETVAKEAFPPVPGMGLGGFVQLHEQGKLGEILTYSTMRFATVASLLLLIEFLRSLVANKYLGAKDRTRKLVALEDAINRIIPEIVANLKNAWTTGMPGVATPSDAFFERSVLGILSEVHPPFGRYVKTGERQGLFIGARLAEFLSDDVRSDNDKRITAFADAIVQLIEDKAYFGKIVKKYFFGTSDSPVSSAAFLQDRFDKTTTQLDIEASEKQKVLDDEASRNEGGDTTGVQSQPRGLISRLRGVANLGRRVANDAITGTKTGANSLVARTREISALRSLGEGSFRTRTEVAQFALDSRNRAIQQLQREIQDVQSSMAQEDTKALRTSRNEREISRLERELQELVQKGLLAQSANGIYTVPNADELQKVDINAIKGYFSNIGDESQSPELFGENGGITIVRKSAPVLAAPAEGAASAPEAAPAVAEAAPAPAPEVAPAVAEAVPAPAPEVAPAVAEAAPAPAPVVSAAEGTAAAPAPAPEVAPAVAEAAPAPAPVVSAAEGTAAAPAPEATANPPTGRVE